jgi:rhodanese-related sulfurtransferase
VVLGALVVRANDSYLFIDQIEHQRHSVQTACLGPDEVGTRFAYGEGRRRSKMAKYETVNATEAKALIESEPVTIVDLRDARSYRNEHIDGAVLHHEALEKALVERGELDRPVLFYCYRGVTSKEKAGLFAAMGFTRVYSLDNGFVGWTDRAKNT